MIQQQPDKTNASVALSSPEKINSEESIEKKVDNQGSKWTSKSLNSLPTEHYEMDLTKTVSIKSNALKDTTTTPTPDSKPGESGQKILPQPKIKKVNEKTFCITIDNVLYVFYHLDQAEKIKMKITKKSFGMLKYEVESNIQFVAGNGSNYIFVGTVSNLIILEMYKKEDKYFIKEANRKQIAGLRAVTFIGQEIIAVSNNEVFQYALSGNFNLVAKKSIQFPTDSDQRMFSELKSIGLVVESIFCFYFFGTKIEQKVDHSSKRKFSLETPAPSKMCEMLTIVKFNIEHNMSDTSSTAVENSLKHSKLLTNSQLAESKIMSIKTEIYPIDHVFETGIFEKSKIFEIDESAFLMSLHEEIILIKKHFKKFIVWDNVSIMSSKSQEKKGQLILADKRILVYSQNGQIFAHDIFFNEHESRINMPPIDGFRGNDNDEEILYDAVLLEYDKESLMKVLFYFKEIDVILPNKSKFRKQPENPNDPAAGDENTLSFTMLCINQSDPKEKLMQMLRLKKQPNQIAEFCERFNINSLQKTKCMWSVSDKSLKDIENVLLEISDDKYIQTELDNILKKQPHNLTFLISVEKKQIARLKKLVVKNLLSNSESNEEEEPTPELNPREAERKRIEYVKKVIQWLMESIMFEKKLEYSKNFLSFKEYDFIEIGKLKAASLKEEIKLLSCKKYEKRLKYFLNSFKVLAIANWEEIFRFLLVNKNETEIKEFLKDFRFILPRFIESSVVFQAANQYKLNAEHRLIRGDETSVDDEKCYLWDDLNEIQTIVVEIIKNTSGSTKDLDASAGSNQEGQRPLNTVQDFSAMIIDNIKALKREPAVEEEAIRNFEQILIAIVDSQWFNMAAFKQHSMLNKTSTQLQEEFHELKNKRAYQILIKYMYEQVERGNPDITVVGIQSMLEQYVRIGLIPESFKRNDDARLEVYKILERNSFTKEDLQLKKSKYLVMNEDQYFSFLFKQIRPEILQSVKAKYDHIEKGFFRERFEIYLKSTYVGLKNIINFLDDFEGKDADDVRIDVFNCIKRLLRLGDQQNTKNFIQKSLDKEVLPDNSNQQTSSYDMNLREQAKIPYAFVFFHFFRTFNLDYTYEELIQATQNSNLGSNGFLKSLIKKYCTGMYECSKGFQGEDQCLIDFQDNKIINEKIHSIDIHQKPLQFFGIILYMVDLLDFQVDQTELYNLILQEYLNEGRAVQQRSQKYAPSPVMKPPKNVTPGFESKFEELFSFVKSIQNYIMTGEDLNTKNYTLINDFKDGNDAEQIFVDYTLDWISRAYSSISEPSDINYTMRTVEQMLRILERSNKSSRKVKEALALYHMLEFLKKFNFNLITRIDFIKQEMQHSGFIFLIHMFHAVGVDNFVTCSLEEEQSDSHISISNRKGPSSTFVKIYNWNCIYSQFKIIKGEENIDDRDNPQFIRFIIEVCCIMISEQKYEIAWDFLLRAVNQTCYFKDAFYYFVSEIEITDEEEFRQSLRSFLSTETAKNLKNKLNVMLNGSKDNSGEYKRVIKIPESTLNQSVESSLKREMLKNKTANALFLFRQLLESNRADEAFYFLTRIKKIPTAEVQVVAKKAKRLSPLGLYSYLLLASYMKCLQKYISDEFHPTFLFFKSKYEILIDIIERRDIIKDVNIAISRLKNKFQEQENEVIKKDIFDTRAELHSFYIKYMGIIQEDPVIKLTEEDEEQATKRIQIYARMAPDTLLEEENKQEEQAKIKLQENQEKLHKIHENNKLNVIHKEISESVSEAKRAADKYANILEEKKRQASKMTYAEKKEQELLEIKRKQEQDVESIKDSFKSNTTQKVNELIEQLRMKREKINESRYKSSVIREHEEKNNVPSKDVDSSNKLQGNLPSSKYNIQIRNPTGKTEELLEGRTSFMGKNSDIIERGRKSIMQGEELPSEKFLDMQKRVKRLQEPSSLSKGRITSDEINKLFQEKQPQAVKYLQKFDLIKQNMQVGVQLVKRVYSVIQDLSNFVQFIRYLMGHDVRYKDVLEEKSLAIVSQMIKMDQKLDLKELIPIEIFTTVHKVSSKDYYAIAYDIFKPSLKKVMEKEKIAVHALGILMRYSLGSETKYFHRVFDDYIRVLLKNYELRVYDDKDTFLLAEKLRSQYSNLETENREFKFEQLINEINNESKRKRLVEALKKAISRKTDSVIGGNQTEEISRAVLRLSNR